MFIFMESFYKNVVEYKSDQFFCVCVYVEKRHTNAAKSLSFRKRKDISFSHTVNKEITHALPPFIFMILNYYICVF